MFLLLTDVNNDQFTHPKQPLRMPALNRARYWLYRYIPDCENLSDSWRNLICEHIDDFLVSTPRIEYLSVEQQKEKFILLFYALEKNFYFPKEWADKIETFTCGIAFQTLLELYIRLIEYMIKPATQKYYFLLVESKELAQSLPFSFSGGKVRAIFQNNSRAFSQLKQAYDKKFFQKMSGESTSAWKELSGYLHALLDPELLERIESIESNLKLDELLVKIRHLSGRLVKEVQDKAVQDKTVRDNASIEILTNIKLSVAELAHIIRYRILFTPYLNAAFIKLLHQMKDRSLHLNFKVNQVECFTEMTLTKYMSKQKIIHPFCIGNKCEHQAIIQPKATIQVLRKGNQEISAHNFAYFSCGHVLCFICGPLYDNCPVCNKYVKGSLALAANSTISKCHHCEKYLLSTSDVSEYFGTAYRCCKTCKEVICGNCAKLSLQEFPVCDASKENRQKTPIDTQLKLFISPVALSKAVADHNQTPSLQKECVLCMDRPISMVFIPCGHAVCCFDCTRELLSNEVICPICRAVIQYTQYLVLPAAPKLIEQATSVRAVGAGMVPLVSAASEPVKTPKSVIKVEKNICQGCQKNPISSAYVPCGHSSLCWSCVFEKHIIQKQRFCITCECPFAVVQKIYYSDTT